MSEFVRITSGGAVTRIGLDRGDHGNRVTNEMAAEIGTAIDRAGADGTKLIVLAGAGPDFCLGREPPPGSESGSAVDIRKGNTGPALDLFARFQRCPAPILGIVQGTAAGMGCALAALCDITIAAEDARFRVPEMDRDLPPTIVLWALADRIPRKAAAGLVYTREAIDARTALSFGLITRIAPADGLSEAAEAMIVKLAENSLPSLAAVKEYMRGAPEMERQGAADFAGSLLANVLSSKPGP